MYFLEYQDNNETVMLYVLIYAVYKILCNKKLLHYTAEVSLRGLFLTFSTACLGVCK